MSETLTPLYRFLIYLEELESIKLSDINFVEKKSIRGILGKMEAMSLVKRTDDIVSLSKKGYDLLNSVLDVLHRPTMHWDGKWRIVYFSTPESLRTRRDKFRRDLESQGFRPIIKGLWASPVDKKSVYSTLVKQNSMQGMSLFIETSKLDNLNQETIGSAWQLDKFRSNLESYISQANSYFSSRERDKISAKELIFRLAMLLNNNPALPIEFLPSDWPEYRAKLMYKKLRNIITS